jgi:hypothetical protein
VWGRASVAHTGFGAVLVQGTASTSRVGGGSAREGLDCGVLRCDRFEGLREAVIVVVDLCVRRKEGVALGPEFPQRFVRLFDGGGWEWATVRQGDGAGGGCRLSHQPPDSPPWSPESCRLCTYSVRRRSRCQKGQAEAATTRTCAGPSRLRGSLCPSIIKHKQRTVCGPFKYLALRNDQLSANRQLARGGRRSTGVDRGVAVLFPQVQMPRAFILLPTSSGFQEMREGVLLPLSPSSTREKAGKLGYGRGVHRRRLCDPIAIVVLLWDLFAGTGGGTHES